MSSQPPREAAADPVGGPPPLRAEGPAEPGVVADDPALAEAILGVERREADPDHAPLGHYWDLGRIAEGRAASRASRPSNRDLAGDLRVEPTRLQAARRIYRAFPTPSGRDRLVALRRADGTPPPVGLVARIASTSLAADREALIVRACRENWSEYDARDRLRAGRGVGGPARSGGRKHKLPRSLPLALARWQRDAEDRSRRARATFRPDIVEALLASPDAAEVTRERVLEVRRSVERTLKAVLAELGALDQIADGLAAPGATPPPRSTPTPPASSAGTPSKGRRTGKEGRLDPAD